MLADRQYWAPELEAMTMPQLRANHLGRLKPLLEWAYNNSPYYRESFDAAGIRPADVDSLETFSARVPFITKEGIIEAEQAKPTYGGFLAVPTADLARIYVAPGPIYMPFTAEDFDGIAETCAVGMWAAGVRPSDIADVTTNYHWVIAGTQLDASYRKVGCAVVPGGIGNTKMHVEAMRDLGVTTTFAFSTFFVQLAETAKEMGLDLRRDLKLRVALIGGEMKPKEAIAELEAQYDMKVREIYGTADLAVVGFECDARAGMHLGPHHIVEILDPVTHQPVPEGDGGEIVVTALFRKAMPIIRYRTGDVVGYVSYDSCSCGRHTPRLGPIVGRVGDIPRVKGMFIVPKQIQNALYPFKGLRRFQMVIDRPQLGDVLTVRIEAEPGVDRAGSKAAVQKALREAIRIGAEIDFVDAGMLPEGTPLVIDLRRA
ncbi:MAG: AMP-binding protein [Chloroflexi bacterium]|nr:AMP-binding protein [Chloroflexota bacterium]